VISDHTFTASWTAGLNATSYALFVSDDNFNSVLPAYDSLIVSGLSYDVTGLTAGQTYYFKMRSLNVYGYSNYSLVGTAVTTTGLNKQETATIFVYPNPASDKIFVQLFGLEGIQIISLYDAAGVLILEIEGVAEAEISLEKLPQGIYYLRVLDAVTKIIKN